MKLSPVANPCGFFNKAVGRVGKSRCSAWSGLVGEFLLLHTITPAANRLRLYDSSFLVSIRN